MAKKKSIAWTDKQKEVADLLRQGKTREELLSSGFPRTTVDKVISTIKDELAEIKRKNRPVSAPDSAPLASRGPSKPPSDTPVKLSDVIQVGQVLIEPYDWRMNQYGVFLILTTYEQAKTRWAYGGTLGEFLCDCVQLARGAMKLDLMACDYFLKEDDNGAGIGKQTEHGAGLLETGSGQSDGDLATEAA